MKIGEFLKRSRQQLVTCLPDNSLAAGGEAYVLAWHWRDAGVRERQSHDRYCLGTGPRARLREDRLERAAVSTSARHHDDAGYKLRTRRHDAGRTGPDADKPLPPSACCPGWTGDGHAFAT